MDLNLAVIGGRLVSAPDVERFSTGSVRARMLIAVRSDTPMHRIDVIPVSWWDPSSELETWVAGDVVFIAGAVQRRFWEGHDGRRSRIEVVASDVTRALDLFQQADPVRR